MRTSAEADLNTEPARVAKKASTGRAKSKGKENDVPAPKRAASGKQKQTAAPGATRASAVKAKGKEIDAPAPKKGVKKGKARSKKENRLSTKESVCCNVATS